MKSLLIGLFLCSFSSFGQLKLYATTPDYVENGDLFGPDYTVFNTEYSGSGYSYAQFNGVNSNLGLTRGFVMTTGRLADQSQGLLGPNVQSDAGFDMGTPGYPLLSSLIGGTATNDAAVLEFDFIPHTDTLVFNYSFGSEEYEEYVGSTFSDIAAVFLIGPGLPAPTNYLTVGNGVPVSLDNVHNGVSNQFGNFPPINETYYYDNTTWSGDSTRITLDGFTINTQVRIDNLQIDSTYHLIIAIADAVDGNYDSGLFIEACETCLPTLSVEEEKEATMLLSPNPVVNQLHIETSGEHSFQIIDALGQEVNSRVIYGSTSLDCSTLPAGMYLFKLNSGEIKRFMKR
jgi:hypothetical protein